VTVKHDVDQFNGARAHRNRGPGAVVELANFGVSQEPTPLSVEIMKHFHHSPGKFIYPPYGCDSGGCAHDPTFGCENLGRRGFTKKGGLNST
jgi:hypothetical protein